MSDVVNELEYGLTCSIWTRDLERAHRTAMAVDVGYVWINETSRHILGAPFGGMKQSGIGREECLGELLAFTQEKNIFISLGSGNRCQAGARPLSCNRRAAPPGDRQRVG